MAVFSPFVLLKPVLLVAGLAAVGMGGYNLTTTGCPLGTCSTSHAQNSQPAVSTVSDAGRTEAVMGQGCARHMVSTPVADTDMAGMGCDAGMKCDAGMECDADMGCDMAPGASMMDCPMSNTADASDAHCQGQGCDDGADCPYNTANQADTADQSTMPSDSSAQALQSDDSTASEG